MKNISILILIFLTISFSQISAQDYRYTLNEKGQAEYSEVVSAYPLKAVDLKANAEAWARLQLYNKYSTASKGKVVIIGSIPVSRSSIFGPIDMGIFNYTLIIEVKDNKYRYTITEIEHKGKFKDMGNLSEVAAGSKKQQRAWDEMKRSFEQKILNYAGSLKFHMDTKPEKLVAWE